MQRSDFRHWFSMPVRWGDLDALGHVNNVQYYRYYESARVDYAEQVFGIRMPDRQGIVLADMQCSFLRQLHYPAQLEVGTRTSRLGNTSARLTTAIFIEGEAKPVSTAQGVVVWFDFEQQRSCRVPEPIRQAVQSFETVPVET